MRSALSWLHLWVGLSVGIVFATVRWPAACWCSTPICCGCSIRSCSHTRRTPTAACWRRILDDGTARPALARPAARGIAGVAGLSRRRTPRLFRAGGRRLLLVRSHHDDVLMWLHELARRTARRQDRQGSAGRGRLDRARPAADRTLPVVAEAPAAVLAQLKMHAGPPVRRWLTWHRSSGALMLPLMLLSDADRRGHGVFERVPVGADRGFRRSNGDGQSEARCGCARCRCRDRIRLAPHARRGRNRIAGRTRAPRVGAQVPATAW